MGRGNPLNASLIEVRREGALTHLRLARPDKGNSLSREMVRQMASVVDACQTDGTRGLLIDAAGPNFCTGFDLSDLDIETDDTLLARFVRVELLLQSVHRAPFLTAALAQGKTWGAGADLFAACQLRWAAPGTTFAFPGAAFGLVLGTGRLGALVGATHASDWILSGRQIGVEEAGATGLVQRYADAPQARALHDTVAQRLQRLDPETHAHVSAALQLRSLADDAIDLNRLVQTAARPGLKARIVAYRAASRPPT